MRRLIIPLLTACVVIAGYDPVSRWLNNYMPLSAEGKVSTAFTLPSQSEVQIQRIEKMDGAKQVEFQSQLQNRLKLRALSCSTTGLPSWYESTDQVRARFANPECFAAQDKQIAAWLGLIEIGLILRQPPTTALSASAPNVVQMDAFIQSVTFADEASVALINTVKDMKTVDLTTGRVLFQQPQDRSALYSKPSPNGRLYAESRGDTLSIRNTVNGDVVAQIENVVGYQFLWLDNHTAAYITRDKSSLWFIDFDNATTVNVKASVMLGRVVAAPGKPDHYIVLGDRYPSEFQLVRNKRALEATLIAQPMALRTDAPLVSTALNTGGLSVDGQAYISAVGNLSVFSLDTLESKIVDTFPFTILEAKSLPEKNLVLLKGRLPESRQHDQELYVLDITSQTIAPVSQTEIASQRIEYVYPLAKIGVIDDRRLMLLDELPLEPPKPLAHWRSEQVQTVADRKLERLNPQMPGLVGSSPGMTPPERPISPLIAGLVAGAQVEGVGVYEAKNGYHGSGAHQPGLIDVEVRRSSRPIVLVLTSYEPVRWRLNRQPGANVSAVILSSYYPSEVEGSGVARVLVAGSNHAYARESGGFATLNRQVLSMIGKPIEVFQGSYSGERFSVGGN